MTEVKQEISTEPEKKQAPANYELLIKLIGPTLTAIGLILGAWQFTTQQENNDRLEFKRRIWEKRLNAYIEIGNLTALIVTANSDTALQRLSIDFEKQYWGKLPLFEDDSVERAMKHFRWEIKDRLEGVNDLLNSNRLTEKGYSLMQTCQRSLHRGWKELGE